MKFSFISFFLISYGLISIFFGVFKIDFFLWFLLRTFALKSWANKSDKRFINIIGGIVCLILGVILTFKR
jgi:hypothetical protein